MIAVVAVTYNSATQLPGLIASLPEGLAGLSWRLVVVDNASRDDSVAVARRLAPEAVVVETGRNAGYAAGINIGVSVAGGPTDAVLVLNPDVRLEPGCGRRLFATLAEPGVGVAVPRLVDGDGVLIDSMRREPTIRRALVGAVIGIERAGRFGLGEVITDRRLYEEEQDIDWAEGSTQMISADCWKACGPWDESYFLYSEETDFDLRASDAGFTTRYVPEARAIHLEGGSGSSPQLWALLTVNGVRHYRRRHGRALAVGFWLASLARETSRAMLGRKQSQAAVRALVRPSILLCPPGPAFLSRA